MATATAGAAAALTATTAGRAKAALHDDVVAAGELAPAAVEPAFEQSAVAAPAAAPAIPPWEIVAPLTAGSAVAADWRLTGLTGVEDGSAVLTLANHRGREQRVHLCRNDGTPQGLVFTERFDLVVMNGGRGDLPTEESFGQAIAAVAHAIAANERSPRHDRLVGQLLPQTQRLEKFAATARLR